jgi:flagellar basal-body rod protein FlgG
MEASLWVSKTGLDAQQMRMTVISNNLANVNTVGFKRDRAVFEDLLYQNIRQAGGSTGGDNQSPTGLMIGTGVRIVATEKTHTQGSMIQTKNALDLAIQGEGMFQVLQPDGTFAYTRDGSFKLSVDRELVTSNGMHFNLRSRFRKMLSRSVSVRMEPFRFSPMEMLKSRSSDNYF